MAYDSNIFVDMDVLPKPISITLPDGSSKTVTLVGNVMLDDNIKLKRVLYVPEFKFNLLSVTRLLTDQRLCIHIYPAECIFQDLFTNQIVVVAHEHGGLYKLQSSQEVSMARRVFWGWENPQEAVQITWIMQLQLTKHVLSCP